MFTGDLAPLLAVVVSYSKGNASAVSIWSDTLTVGERHWDQAILRYNGTGKSLCQLSGGLSFAPELLKNSLLTPGKHTLVLGCLTLPLQIGLTVFSELGERMARFAPDVNPGASRRHTWLKLISSNDKLHGTINPIYPLPFRLKVYTLVNPEAVTSSLPHSMWMALTRRNLKKFWPSWTSEKSGSWSFKTLAVPNPSPVAWRATAESGWPSG